MANLEQTSNGDFKVTSDAREVASASSAFLLDRLWSAYELVDNRRRKSFYFLFTTTTVCGLLWLTRPTTFKLPVIETEVGFFVAMATSPAFILMFASNYYYLCAHTISNYLRWLEHFCTTHEKEIGSLGLRFVELHASLKQRDVTEGLNIYLFHTAPSSIYDAPLPSWVRRFKGVLANLLRVLTVVIPPAVYVGITFWLWMNQSGHIPIGVAVMLVGFYSAMASAFLLGPLYFYYRVKPFRDYFNTRLIGDTYEK